VKPEQANSERIARGYPGAERKSLLRLIFFSDVFASVGLLLIYTAAACCFFFILAWLVYNKRYDISLAEYIQMFF